MPVFELLRLRPFAPENRKTLFFLIGSAKAVVACTSLSSRKVRDCSFPICFNVLIDWEAETGAISVPVRKADHNQFVQMG